MAENLVTFSDDNFDSEVLQSDKPVLVDFWAPWCAPCRQLMPLVEELADDYSGSAKIGKVNIDENPATAQKYGVMSIPTVLVFKNGEVQQTFVGVQAKGRYSEALDSSAS
ncbi:Thioredoxin [Planctomycetales bacterium 10988]|nr:Thioredoxin [Planctomycetales bacterium 10988]